MVRRKQKIVAQRRAENRRGTAKEHVFAPQGGKKIPAWGIAPGERRKRKRALKGRQDINAPTILSPLQGSKL
jgi:hypothetical protein